MPRPSLHAPSPAPPANPERARMVARVQEYLRTIAFEDLRLPLPAVDGVYGPATAAAVRAFQSGAALPVTGRVDADTHAALVAEATRIRELRPAARAVLPPRWPGDALSPGDAGMAVRLLQEMLSALCERYDNLLMPETDGAYGENTARAVARFQPLCMLPETGRTDTVTWNRLCALYNSLQA